jgi:RNA polymerase sigma-70 factor (ECF subfamily)
MGRVAVSDADEVDDRELMARVREGELAQLAALFDRHARRLHGFFLRWTADRAVAEDLVQEVFVRILKYRHTYRDGAEFAPWLWALARNAAADLWRGRPRELAADETTPEPVDPEPHALAALERREQLDQLAAALERLAPERRELLLLARFSELDYRRIAELLGVSVGAVKVRVHRALKELKTAYLAVAGEGAA